MGSLKLPGFQDPAGTDIRHAIIVAIIYTAKKSKIKFSAFFVLSHDHKVL